MQESGHAPEPPPHRVVVLALAPVIGYDLTIPPQVLGEARGRRRAPALRRRRCVDRGRRTGGGERAATPIAPSAGPEALADAETVIVPGHADRRSAPRGHAARRRARGARDRARRGARLGVDLHRRLRARRRRAPRRATAPPPTGSYADDFRRALPRRSTLDEDVLFIDDGDVLTSAGLSAGIDLCLHLVRTRPRHRGRQRGGPPHASCRRGATAARRSSSSATCPRRVDETTGDVRAWALGAPRTASSTCRPWPGRRR